MIYIEPLGGICNRLRAIASAIWLSEKISKPLTVIWNVNKEFNITFESLFQPVKEFKLIGKSGKFQNVKSSNQKSNIKRLLGKGINKFYGIDYCIKEMEIKNYKEDYFESLKRFNTIYIVTCEQFGFPSNYFSIFKPVSSIQNEIDKITRNFNSDTIGIHIRRTDNMMSILNSPIDLFYNKLEEEIKKMMMIIIKFQKYFLPII